MAKPEQESIEININPATQETIFTINPRIFSRDALRSIVDGLIIHPTQNTIVAEDRDLTYFMHPYCLMRARSFTRSRQNKFVNTTVDDIKNAERLTIVRTPNRNN